MGPPLKFRRRLVETDVTVRADPEYLQVDATGSGDRALVAGAFLIDVRSGPVEEVDEMPGDVHAAEQVRLHVGAVAAGVIRREAEELVEIERARLGQIDFAEFGQRSELLVKANRGAAG